MLNPGKDLLSIIITLVGLIACYAQASISLTNFEEKAPLTSKFNHDLSNLYHINQIDAPKYYDLNALLYKTAPSVGRIFPASRADLEPSSGDASKAHGLDGDREESSFEGLIRAMRRAHESRGSSRDGNQPVLMQADRGAKRSSTSGGSALGGMTDTDIGADNEATVQRKSTNNLDASEDESASLGRASSRLIANGKYIR